MILANQAHPDELTNKVETDQHQPDHRSMIIANQAHPDELTNKVETDQHQPEQRRCFQVISGAWQLINSKPTRMLFIACLCNCASGVFVLSYGAIIPYIHSYLWFKGEKLHMAQLNAHPSIFSISCFTTSFLIGVLSKRINERIVNAVFSLALPLVTLSMFWFANSNVSLSCYMFVIGISVGNMFVYSTAKGILWYQGYEGVASGFNSFSFGLGGLFGSTASSLFINPQNLATQIIPRDINNPSLGNATLFVDSNVYQRVPYIWIAFAVLILVLVLPSTIFLRSPMEDELEDHFQTKTCDTEQNDDRNVSCTAREMLKKPRFYSLYVVTIATAIAQCSGSHLYKQLAKETILNDSFLNMVAIVGTIFAALGRLSFGFLVDRLQAKKALLVAFGILIPSTVLLSWTRKYQWVYLINACFSSFGSGSNAAVAPATVELFGTKDMEFKVSVFLTGEIIANLIFILLSLGQNQLYDDIIFLVLLASPFGLAFVGILVLI